MSPIPCSIIVGISVKWLVLMQNFSHTLFSSCITKNPIIKIRYPLIRTSLRRRTVEPPSNHHRITVEGEKVYFSYDFVPPVLSPLFFLFARLRKKSYLCRLIVVSNECHTRKI